MTNKEFKRLYGSDYSSLKIKDRVIVLDGSTFFNKGTMVSGVISRIFEEEDTNILVDFTDKRTKFIEEQNKIYNSGKVSNIIYKVSENVLRGDTNVKELYQTVINSEVQADNLIFVCSNLDSAIKNYVNNF